MMKKIILTPLLLCCINISLAQINQSAVQDFKPEISQFPKSPEVAAFSKYIDIPATTHTGVMNVSIPIYNFDFDGQNFPISLEYNTSGIKLDEIASRVGLGWTLNIGGISLSKQVMGSPDHPSTKKADVSSGFQPNGFMQNTLSNTYKAIEATGLILNEYPIDFLPDLYNFSLLNNSGKFILDFETKKALTIPSSFTEVNRIIRDDGIDFILKDEKGYEYYFEHIRSQHSVNTCTNSHNMLNYYPTDEYFIKYIKSPNNNKIEFEYQNDFLVRKYSTSVIQKKILSGQVTGSRNLRLPLIPPKCYNYTIEGNYPNNVNSVQLLKKIKFNKVEIEIEYSNEIRKDVINDRYLKSIIVKSDSKSTPLLSYNLHTGGDDGYFISDEIYNPLEDYKKGNNYRLKLNGIEETVKGEKYHFEYYSGNLPPRLLDSKDFWGVYNGKNNSNSFATSLYYDYQSNTYKTYISGNNLSADINFGKIGNLRKITYPTGGTQELFYENDDFIIPSNYNLLYNSLGISNGNIGKTGTLRVSKVVLDDMNGSRIEKKFTYLNPQTGKTSGINYGTFNLNVVKKDVVIDQSNYAQPSRAFYNYLTNNPGWQLTTINGKSVGYSFVQEIVSDYKDNSKSYKIEYEYFHDEESYESDWTFYDPNTMANMSYPIFYPERGLLKTKKYYNHDDILVKKESFEYNFDNYFNRESSIALNENMLYKGVEIAVSDMRCAEICYYEFEYFPFDIKTSWIQNKKTTTTDYLPNGEVVTTVENNYSPDYKHLYPTNTVTTNSKGDVLTTEYQYPSDLKNKVGYEQRSIMTDMVERNMISSPVITKTFNGSTVLSEQRTLYKYVPGTNNSQLILPSFVYAKKGVMGESVVAEDRKITYNSYDNRGNLTQYTLENGIPVSIIWGYGGQYPVAKIEGVALSSISNSSITTLQTSIDDATLKNAIASLRTAHNSAMVTGYIYKPLVGVTNIIQPNGQEERYTYDEAGRLKEIRNDKGELLKSFEYNYAQP